MDYTENKWHNLDPIYWLDTSEYSWLHWILPCIISLPFYDYSLVCVGLSHQPPFSLTDCGKGVWIIYRQ